MAMATNLSLALHVQQLYFDMNISEGDLLCSQMEQPLNKYLLTALTHCLLCTLHSVLQYTIPFKSVWSVHVGFVCSFVCLFFKENIILNKCCSFFNFVHQI